MLLSLVLLINLSGCSVMSQEECQLGQWYQIGLNDGREGKEYLLSEYAEDCAEYQIKVDANSFNQGREEGLIDYCTYENGKQVGKLNLPYNSVCLGESSKAFLFGYTPYYNLASAKANLSSIQDKVNYYQGLVNKGEKKKESQAHLKQVKSDYKSAKTKVKKYKLNVVIHKLVKKIKDIDEKLLNNDDLSEEDKSSLESERAHLKNSLAFHSAKSNIKRIINLFGRFKTL